MGGGIIFRFDLATFGAEFGDPELLAGNRGWGWGRRGGNRVEMRFEPALAAVYFERGRKSEIRAFFYQGEVPQGKRRYLATLSVAGDMKIGPTLMERFGLEDPAAWPADILDWNASPVDLSFLNAPEKPAGKRGFLKVVDDKLVFEDGTPARFWGTNLGAAAFRARLQPGAAASPRFFLGRPEHLRRRQVSRHAAPELGDAREARLVDQVPQGRGHLCLARPACREKPQAGRPDLRL